MRFVGLNGINTHGETNIDVLLRVLSSRGHETFDLRLPKRHTVSAIWGAKKDAQAVLPFIEKDDILVAHSFGCARAAELLKLSGYIDKAFLIAPAMSNKYTFQFPENVWCFCSVDDWVVSLGAKIPHPVFGLAGVTGFNQLAPLGHNFHKKSDHNGWFSEPLLSFVSDKIQALSVD